MARRNRIGKERNPFKMVLYIVAVICLLGCIWYFLYSSGEKKKVYQDEVKKAAAQETELQVSSETEEEETETAAAQTKVKENGTKTTVTSTTEKEDPAETEEASSENAGEETAAADKEINVLVLNGTKREGVAGYWKTQLEQAGYKNVFPVTYTKSAEEQTVIYTKTQKMAEPFLELFPDAKIEIGAVEEGLELGEGVALPEERDVSILIGLNDVKN